jgi:hypothetical protein
MDGAGRLGDSRQHTSETESYNFQDASGSRWASVTSSSEHGASGFRVKNAHVCVEMENCLC